MIQIIAFLLLTLFSVTVLVGIIFFSVCCIPGIAGKGKNSRKLTRLKKAVIIFAAIMVLNAGLVVFSQFTASTPQIWDENGDTSINSIVELNHIELNGRKEWISIRGEDNSKPVLLFLAGGPGGTQMAAVRHELAELEKHFIVVGWDQPGSGKSYFTGTIKDITVETYIQDGYALTQYLANRFGEEKIYLVGESWGSALGIFLIQRYPETYHAFIGTAQMIDFAETEKMDYQKAMEIAREKNDIPMLTKLEANGAPPYYGKDVTWKSAVYLNYLSAYMTHNPAIHNPGYNTLRDISSSEYGILDKLNFARGMINTFNHVYQQLYDIDLRTDYNQLNVPVYFFEGRHDLNAPPSLVEDYMQVLNAPRKEIVWFEHSGHSSWINERGKFAKEVITCFLKNSI